MKLLLLSTLSLASNPRLVKEIRLFLDNSFEVEVICFEFDNWSRQINNSIIKEFKNKNVKVHLINAGRENVVRWMCSVFAEKFSRLLSRIYTADRILSDSISRRSSLLIKGLEKITQADIVIGHNPGSVFPVYLAGRKLGCKTGFDMEDYHPGEGSNKVVQRNMNLLFRNILPKLDYVTYAGPLIRDRVVHEIPGVPDKGVILNCFPKSEFYRNAKIPGGKLKLVWFSQHISAGRGLEEFLLAIQGFQDALELHLYGNQDPAFCIPDLRHVFVHGPLPQIELHKCLSKYDIGLAVDPALDLNRELAISNKLVCYLQSGLYVLFASTPNYMFCMSCSYFSASY